MEANTKEQLKFWLVPGTFLKLGKERSKTIEAKFNDDFKEQIKNGKEVSVYQYYARGRSTAEAKGDAFICELVRLAAYGWAIYEAASFLYDKL